VGGGSYFDGEVVEFSVILDGSEFAVLLFDEEEGGGERGFRRSDKSAGGHVGEEGVEGGLFGQVKGVNLTVVRWGGVGMEVDGMVEQGSRWEGVRGIFGEDGGKIAIGHGD
jgi:hypothetical protein